jgi:hypothetical protein
LRDIDDLCELKLTLHSWRLIHQQKGSARYLRRSQLEADRGLLLALRTCAPEDPKKAVGTALEAACERGTLLCLEVRTESGPETCYFLNTLGNRRLIEQVQAGLVTLGPFEPVQESTSCTNRMSDC